MTADDGTSSHHPELGQGVPVCPSPRPDNHNDDLWRVHGALVESDIGSAVDESAVYVTGTSVGSTSVTRFVVANVLIRSLTRHRDGNSRVSTRTADPLRKVKGLATQ
jgi:hypothetical protein